MMKISRYLIVAICCVLLTTGLGCKGQTAAEVAATQPVTLEYWTVFDDLDALQPMIDAYRADRPYLTINIRQLTQDELYPRLVEALAEDKGPDIVSVYNRNLRALETKLTPMPVSVADNTVAVIKGQFTTQTTVNTAVRNMVTPDRLDREYVQAVKKDVVMDGKVYGLPLSMDDMALYYNKDLLDRAGIPEPPKTWEEFQKAVKKLTKYDKTTGVISQAGAALGTGNNLIGSDDLLYILFKQSNIDMMSADGRAVFNTVPQNSGPESPSMNVVNFFTDFANPTRDTYTWNAKLDNALDKFVNGSLAFFFGYSYNYSVIKARAPQLNFQVIPMLQLNPEQPVNAASYWVEAVTLKSKHQNEAWALIDYLAHSKATKDYLDKSVRPTALRAYINEQSQNTVLAPFASQVLIADNWYRGSDYAAAKKTLDDMLTQWLEPPANPEQLLQYRQDILNRAAAKVNQTL